VTYEAVIGLEVHAQLTTRTKLFCGCGAEFGAPPNSRTCPVCLGLPGALPALNGAAVAMALKVALATGCRIPARSLFARKSYFYPDLPKGYQITQYEEPLALAGHLEVPLDSAVLDLGITRIHLEEDAGKSLHVVEPERATLVDLNRAGVPLVEIVTEPQLRDGRQARACVEELRRLLMYLDVCDGNLYAGSLRCDANVSVRAAGSEVLGAKVEIKNLNSLRAVQLALDHEIARQSASLEAGHSVREETRGWDPDAGRTLIQRVKERAPDYRYFPEPDLPPLLVTQTEMATLRRKLPELPRARAERLVREHGLPAEAVAVLTATRDLADYFEATVRTLGDARSAAGWIQTEVLQVLHARNLEIRDFPIGPPALARLLELVREGTLSGRLAKEVFQQMLATGEEAAAVVARLGLRQEVDAAELGNVVRAVLEAHPQEVRAYRSGQAKLLTWFMGQAMSRTQGRADPQLLRRILVEQLSVDREGSPSDGETPDRC
jgi:aspartyl-tRNA(Asn)/glutamyl-tRNA(Gln) amidotransferase subunit B